MEKKAQSVDKQCKFFVDLSKEPKSLGRVLELLVTINDKSYGREIIFKDLALYAIEKLTDKDTVKIQEISMSEMEKVERAMNEYNEKNKTSLSMGEFLVKKLGIS